MLHNTSKAYFPSQVSIITYRVGEALVHLEDPRVADHLAALLDVVDEQLELGAHLGQHRERQRIRVHVASLDDPTPGENLAEEWYTLPFREVKHDRGNQKSCHGDAIGRYDKARDISCAPWRDGFSRAGYERNGAYLMDPGCYRICHLDPAGNVAYLISW